jgi:aryl-alcohol dehydrogenase-like predicted oxidoreductase
VEHRNIGSLRVSVVGLGAQTLGGRLGAAASRRLVDAALDAGITFFDTSDVENGGLAEELLGAALGPRRSEVTVGTKFGAPGTFPRALSGGDPRWVPQAVEQSLRRLDTDHLDLVQVQVPDPVVPIEDTLGALAELVRAGKVREVGCSQFGVGELRGAVAAAHEHGLPRLVADSVRYSVLWRQPEAGLRGTCDELGVALLPYQALEGGILTGKYDPGEPPPPRSRLALASPERTRRFLRPGVIQAAAELAALARGTGRRPVDLAVSWLLSQPAVPAVIVGATTPEQVQENAAAGSWRLTAGELDAIDAIVARWGLDLASSGTRSGRS